MYLRFGLFRHREWDGKEWKIKETGVLCVYTWYMYVCMYLCMYVFMYVYMYVCMYVCMCVYVCVYVCVCMYVCMKYSFLL